MCRNPDYSRRVYVPRYIRRHPWCILKSPCGVPDYPAVKFELWPVLECYKIMPGRSEKSNFIIDYLGGHTYRGTDATCRPQENEMKWNESGFRPPLCTYRLSWARRTSWGWWDDWDDTAHQTQDSKFEPWRSEAELATSRSQRLPAILTFTRGWGRNIFCFFQPPRPGIEPRTLAWKAAVLTTTLGPPPVAHRKATRCSRFSAIHIFTLVWKP